MPTSLVTQLRKPLVNKPPVRHNLIVTGRYIRAILYTNFLNTPTGPGHPDCQISYCHFWGGFFVWFLLYGPKPKKRPLLETRLWYRERLANEPALANSPTIEGPTLSCVEKRTKKQNRIGQRLAASHLTAKQKIRTGRGHAACGSKSGKNKSYILPGALRLGILWALVCVDTCIPTIRGPPNNWTLDSGWTGISKL